MGIYYTLWNMILLLPEAIKLLIEVLVVALFVLILWPLDKYIIIALLWGGKVLNYSIFGGVRFALRVFPGERKYIWDEKIGNRGAKNNIWLSDKCSGLRQSKTKDILHTRTMRIILLCVYIVSILPIFHLEKYIPEPYISQVYVANHLLAKIETRLTSGIENYPPFWIKENTEETLVEVVSEEIQEEEEEKIPVYLKLNESTSYANVRESADIHSESLCVVSNEDEMLYQDIYEYDLERFWLKVILPSKSNLEGWISSKVIEPEIIDNLDLQY